MCDSHANWLRRAADEIAKAGHYGWGNTCEDAAEHIDALEAELAALRAEKVSQCGHPSSLMLRSAETGKALYCEMCDTRSQLNDAVKMEAHYRERTEKAEAEAARLQAAIEQTRHASYCASRYYDMVGGVKELGNFEVPRPVYRECNCWKAAALKET